MADVKIVEYPTEDIKETPNLQCAYAFTIENFRIDGKVPAHDPFSMGVMRVNEVITTTGRDLSFAVVETENGDVSKFLNSLTKDSKISFDVVWTNGKSTPKETYREEYVDLNYKNASRHFGHQETDKLTYTVSFGNISE